MDALFKTLAEMNPLAVACAMLAMLFVGWLWRSPLLFGRAWIRLSGIRPGDIHPADIRRGSITAFLTTIIAAVLIGVIAAHSYRSLPMVAAGIFFVWLFIMLDQLNGCIARREPIALFLLATTRSLASLMAGGLVFILWS